MPQSHRHALPAGYRLHWYELISILGQGGFGITYLARDTNLDQQVAIKEFLPAEFATRDHDQTVHPVHDGHTDTYGWGLGRFLTEARLLAQFEHPNIVRVLAVFEANNTAYMVMRYEEGQGLDDALKFRRIEGEATLRAIMASLLDGLAQVHAAGFIHRDIKPANILLRKDGSPVLIDFGSARQAIGEQTRTLTALVSPGYAPFEQYNTSGDADRQGPWTDIYALGAVLYRAVTGKGPPDAMVRVAGVVNGNDPLVPASEAAHGRFSPGLLAAIDAALAFQAERRPQSIAAWREMLAEDAVATTDSATPDRGAETVAADDPAPVTSAADEGLSTVILPRSARDAGTGRPGTTRRRSPWPLALAVALPLTLVAGWLALRPPAEPAPAPAATAPAAAAQQTQSERQLAAERQARQQAEAERQSAEEQARQQAEAERLQAEQQARQRAEATRLQAEQQARQRAEATRLQAEEQARQQAEAERLRAEEQARQQAEAERLRAEQQARQTATVDDTARLTALLDAADADVAALRLTSPAGNNAMEKYRAVAAEEPGNTRAQAGLASIVERYVELAEQTAASGNIERAGTYLDRAEQVLPGTERVLFAREALAATGPAAEPVQPPAAALAAVQPAEQAPTPAAFSPTTTATSPAMTRAGILPCHTGGSTKGYSALDAMTGQMERALQDSDRYQVAWHPGDQRSAPLSIAPDALWSGPQRMASLDVDKTIEAFGGKDIAVVVTCTLHWNGTATAYVLQMASGDLAAGPRVRQSSLRQSLAELLVQ